MWAVIAQTHRRNLLLAGFLLTALASRAAPAQERDGWSIEPSVYLFLAGLTGTVGVGSIEVDLDEPSSAILHINFAAMGLVRDAFSLGCVPWLVFVMTWSAGRSADPSDAPGR